MSDDHIAVIDHKKPVYERVGDKMFTFSAGSFFQNNNSILPSLAAYVKGAIFPSEPVEGYKKPTHLVDAYCGSGFFGISLADSFERVAGVELDTQAVQAAQRNAAINNLKDKTTWLCGQAEEIFGGLPSAGFGGSHSCVIIDVSESPVGCCADTHSSSRHAKGATSCSYSSSMPSDPSPSYTSRVMFTPKRGIWDGSSTRQRAME